MLRQDVVNLLRRRGDKHATHQAESTLPEEFESTMFLDQLTQLGVRAEEIAAVRDATGNDGPAEGSGLRSDY